MSKIQIGRSSRGSTMGVEAVSYTHLDVYKRQELNRETLQGKVVALSERSDIDFDINETLIVELYSKSVSYTHLNS